MLMKRPVQLFFLLLVTALILGVAIPAQAQAVAQSDQLTLMVQNPDGTWVPVAPNSASAVRNPDSVTRQGAVAPRLIDFNQWTACWVRNEATAVFGTYTWVRNGTGTKVTLQCGNKDYGYKHLVDKTHDKEWNAKLAAARRAGWDSQNYRVNSWDDLMHIVTANLLAVPGGYYSESTISRKACRNASYGLWSTQTHKLVYTFRAEAIWSMNNKRIITAFPSSRQICNT